MLIKMKNGNVEDVLKYVGEDLIRRGIATEIKNDATILKAEDNGGAAATVSIEMAVAVPKTENAAVRFFRTLRSR